MEINEYKNYFQNKNLLVITQRYPPKEGYPRNIFVKEQVDILKNYFRKVVVIATSPYVPKILSKFMQPRRRQDAIMENYFYDNVEVYYTKDFILPLDIHKRKWGDKAYKKSMQILEKINFKPDIIHAHFTWPSGYVAVKIGKRMNAPVIITAHGYDVYDLPFRNKNWYFKIRYVLELADHVITVSKNNYEIITKKLNIFDEKVTIIPNGFSLKFLHSIDKFYARKKLGIPNNKIILLNVASLDEYKGHIYLIKAMKEIINMRQDVLLYIIGDGPLRKRLIKYIKKNNLYESVKLIGAKPHDEIPLWMNAADIFVLPSLSESFGIVQLEAMAVGTPVVATYNGGSEEIITSDDYGLLCPPKDPKCLAEKILLALEKKWDHKKIINYASQYTWENVIKEILDLYRIISLS